MSKRRRRNALLADPPGGYHRATYHKYTSAKFYAGVHTTGDFEVAAAYAMGTNSFLERRHPNTYPVVLELDVTGLAFEPDVDAYIQAESAFGAFEAEQALRDLRGGKTVQDIADFYYDSGVESDCTVGSDISCFIFEDNQHYNAAQAFIDHYGDDAGKEFERWARTGKYDKRILVHLVNQRRYLTDFDASRLLRIVAFKPWWPEMMGESYDDEQQEKIDRIEAAGYEVYTLDSLPIGIRADKTIYDSKREAKERQFHGTSAILAAAAFPEIGIPEGPPFPISEVEEGGDEN